MTSLAGTASSNGLGSFFTEHVGWLGFSAVLKNCSSVIFVTPRKPLVVFLGNSEKPRQHEVNVGLICCIADVLEAENRVENGSSFVK